MTASRGASAAPEAKWFAVLTTPRHEKSVMAHLERVEVEAFLPTHRQERVWRNRTRQEIVLPLFPTYLFVRIAVGQRSRVLSAPGVRCIVGTAREPLPVDATEIEALRRTLGKCRAEPYREPVVIGQRVRVTRGPMQGVEGILVRQNNAFRLVISVQLIHQHASIEVEASMVEAVDGTGAPGSVEAPSREAICA